MRTEIPPIELARLLARQVDHLFTLSDAERVIIEDLVQPVLDRVNPAFAASSNKYYRRDGATWFSPFHSGQYCIFLYVFAREVFLRHGATYRSLADRIYFLNKALNGIDLFYEVRMPTVFFLDHPLGTVLGRAEYGEGFRFAQQCTVGNNKGLYPRFGERVTMMSGAKVIGRCQVGDDVVFGANSYVKDQDIPAGSLVFGQSPNVVVKPARHRPAAAPAVG